MLKCLIIVIACSLCDSTEGTPSLARPRIIGGSTINISEVPYSVALFKRQRSNKQYHKYCGGSLITTTVVVSAGHCVLINEDDPYSYAIRAGSTNSTFGGQWIEVQKYIQHENYNNPARWIDSDISLWFLKTPVGLNKNVGLVSLPKQGQDVPDGTMMTHVGWGFTWYISNNTHSKASDVLMHIHMPKVNLEICKQTFPHVGINQICAGNFKDVAGCHGDSGSGLLWNDILIGLDSYGNGVCNTKEPTVFTRVSSFVDWIERNIKQQDVTF